MTVNPNAPIEITAFEWVPDFAQGVVRDLRARWALEEAGLDYRVRLVGQERPPEYLLQQPFDQVPCFNHGHGRTFETRPILKYICQQAETLLPRDPQRRFPAIQCPLAALKSVAPPLLNVHL